MKRDEKRRRILALCEQVKDLDAALAELADREGAPDGPTWKAFKDGVLARRALDLIGLHRRAIAAWGDLYNLARHKPAPTRGRT